MVRYSFRSEDGVVSCDGRLGKGVGFGASKDVGGIFVVYRANRADGGVGSMAMKKEAIGGPFSPECFEKVGVSG